MDDEKALMPLELITDKIISVRGQRVMLDRDLAEIYGVSTKALNQAVKRNLKRFPSDFIFQLNDEEKEEVVTNCDHLARLKYSPTLPYAFTEHGAVMLANVLRSERAVQMSVQVVRAFVAFRGILESHKDLARRIEGLEKTVGVLTQAVSKLIPAFDKQDKKKIGF